MDICCVILDWCWVASFFQKWQFSLIIGCCGSYWSFRRCNGLTSMTCHSTSLSYITIVQVEWIINNKTMIFCFLCYIYRFPHFYLSLYLRAMIFRGLKKASLYFAWLTLTLFFQDFAFCLIGKCFHISKSNGLNPCFCC